VQADEVYYWRKVFTGNQRIIDMEVKRKRGRPKGSKNKPKQAVKRRGRPKGSKNKPKLETKKRGRPRLKPVQTTIFPILEGVSLVRRAPGPRSDTHRWVACDGNDVIGYFKTQKAAHEAYEARND